MCQCDCHVNRQIGFSEASHSVTFIIKTWQFGTSPWFNGVIMGPMLANNAHRLFWTTGRKKVKNVTFEVLKKNIYILSPRLAIPKLRIVSKHLKVSLFIFWDDYLFSACLLRWRARITAFFTARDPDKYTELQYFSIPANVICSVLNDHLGTDGEKHLMCNFVWFVHYSRRLSQCYLSIQEKRESLVALNLTAFVVLIIHVFVMNSLKWFFNL